MQEELQRKIEENGFNFFFPQKIMIKRANSHKNF